MGPARDAEGLEGDQAALVPAAVAEVNDRAGLYSSTAYLYTQPVAISSRTDALDVDDDGSRSTHDYDDGDADQDSLTSVYEGDDDSVITDDVRRTSSPVTFVMAVDPANDGARLRRASDQAEAGQAVQVTVEGQDLGLWRQPLGNGTQRWLEDSFPIPPELTKDQSLILVTLTPVDGSPRWTASQYFMDTILE